VSGAPLVALEGASLGYGRRPILHRVDLRVLPGDFLAIVGPNGGGKTTILRSLLGVLEPIAGRRVQPAPLTVGYVPQRDQVDAIWPLTAAEVASMGRARLVGPARWPGEGDRAAVREALAAVGMAAMASRPFRELSGGQRQRTLIARALAADPQLLALDEPTNGMDPAGELDVMELVEELNRKRGLAVVVISHRVEAVAGRASQLAFVDHRNGLFRVGPREEMLAPGALAALYGRAVGSPAAPGGRAP